MISLIQTISTTLAFFSLFYFIRVPALLAGRLLRMPGRNIIRRLLEQLLAMLLLFIVPIKNIINIFPVFLIPLGIAGLVTGIVIKDWITALNGFAIMALMMGYMNRVTLPTETFDNLFGEKWMERLAPAQRKKMKLWPYRLPISKRPRVKYRVDKDVVIPTQLDANIDLLCDVWQPEDGETRSGMAIIHLHAAAWQAIDKGMLVKPIFERLLAQGHVVVDLAYSLAPAATIEDMLDDLKYTIGWLKTQAEIYQIDTDKIVLMGESGGGHLALLAAYTANQVDYQPAGYEADTSVCGVIGVHAPTDLALAFEEYGQMEPEQPTSSSQITEAMQPRVHDKTAYDRWVTHTGLFPAYRYKNEPGGSLLMVNMLGGTLAEIPEKYAAYSPVTHAHKDCPPTLHLDGAHDWYYPGPHGAMLHAALTKAGAKSVYLNYPSTDHGFLLFLPRISPAGQHGMYSIEHYLAELGQD